MQRLKRLFSPTALAATVATGLLVTAGAAYAADQISVIGRFTYFACQTEETSCQTLYWDDFTQQFYDVYFCCPLATTCSARLAVFIDSSTAWAWCDVPGEGR